MILSSLALTAAIVASGLNKNEVQAAEDNNSVEKDNEEIE